MDMEIVKHNKVIKIRIHEICGLGRYLGGYPVPSLQEINVLTNNIAL
jgi:hypothetical protein